MTTKTTNPYLSSVFDYEKEAEREKQRAEQRLNAEKKIQRTNAIGDAFGLLIDAAGGSAGATINQRGPNPYLLESSKRYNALLDSSEDKQDRLRMIDMGEKGKVRDRAEQLTDVETARDFQVAQTISGRDYSEKKLAEANKREDEQLAAKQAREDQQTAEQRTWADKKDDKDFAQQKELVGLQIDATREKKLPATVGQRTDRTKPMLEDDILFQIPNTDQKIWIGAEEFTEMAWRLIDEKQKSGEIITDPVLKALKKGEVVRPQSLQKVVKDNWEKSKYVLTDLYGQPQAQQAQVSPRRVEYTEKKKTIKDDSYMFESRRTKDYEALDEEYKDIAEEDAKIAKQTTDIDSILKHQGWSDKKRASALYNYMIQEMGASPEKAQAFTEMAIPSIKQIKK